MFHIEYLLPIVALWHTITNEVRKFKEDHTVANNIVCAIHSLVYILHYNYNYDRVEYAIHVSIGYYIYDLLYILQCLQANASGSNIRQRTPFIVHHITGTYLLYNMLTNHNTGPLLESYYVLEASNLMLYLSYHLHKEYRSHKTLISFSEFIQLLWYSYYRVYVFSMLLYHNQPRFFELSRTSQCFIIVIYLMGFAWTCKLVKRNIANYLA